MEGFEISNAIAQAITSICGGSLLDGNNILWKQQDGGWIGKRSVLTKDERACWLEDTTLDNIKSWWCGADSDYQEVFKSESNA